MKNPKLVVGHLMNDQLFVKSVTTSKHLDWLKQLDSEELVEFFAELLRLVTQISDGKKDAETLSVFLSEWHETALLNSCLLYTSPSPRDATLSRMPSSA